MKQILSFAILSILLLSACQSGPRPVLSQAAPRQLQAAKAAPQPSGQLRYSFTRPTGTLFVDLYHDTPEEKQTALRLIDDFFGRYIDKGDIESYHVVAVSNRSDEFNVNVYGGVREFVFQRLLPDLQFYLKQRARFDKVDYHMN